ncbi:hypothetical protein [Pedobacter agri]|uniref:hypothetical protein n=1 Tax=Pedobacter agri TaxID=454586 RepID=UPI00292DC27D|nr:hypothetical protein [Pedobacter agri]
MRTKLTTLTPIAFLLLSIISGLLYFGTVMTTRRESHIPGSSGQIVSYGTQNQPTEDAVAITKKGKTPIETNTDSVKQLELQMKLRDSLETESLINVVHKNDSMITSSTGVLDGRNLDVEEVSNDIKLFKYVFYVSTSLFLVSFMFNKFLSKRVI